MADLAELIEAELGRLARGRRSPEAFEALFRVLWEGVARDGARGRTRCMDRPPMPEQAPDGYHWEAVPDTSLRWRVIEGLAPIVSRRCRYGRPSCKRPAVAELNRGSYHILTGRRIDSWWAYCEHHLYGSWIEDGAVVGWVLREDGVLPLGTKPASSLDAYDYTRWLWAVAADFWLGRARYLVASGCDALEAVSAAQACLEIEARERPVDWGLLDELLETVPPGWQDSDVQG
jgi:hypothetical protein